VLAEACSLSGEQLNTYLAQEGVKRADFERWRIALEEDGQDSAATTKRIRGLERELARKEKALAEAAALLVLKKTLRTCRKKRTTIPTPRAPVNPGGDRQSTVCGRPLVASLPGRRHLARR